MEYPGGKNEHFRHLLFFAFHRGQKAAEAARNICEVYGAGVLGESTARKWFAKFRKGALSLDDTPRSGRPSKFDDERLKTLLKEDGGAHQSIRQLARKMECDHKTVLNHLRAIEFTGKRKGVMVPQKLQYHARKGMHTSGNKAKPRVKPRMEISINKDSPGKGARTGDLSASVVRSGRTT